MLPMARNVPPGGALDESLIPTANIEVTRMSVRQLKAELAARDVEISHCRDRSELLALLRKARAAGPWDSGSFAMRRQQRSFCWVEMVEGRQAYSHFGEGATAIQNVEDLEPVTAAEMPCPARFEGSFEAARAQAFLKSKLLVVAVVSGRGKPQKDEALQYLALASDEVRSVLSENAIFWRGRPAELKDTQLRQLAPMDTLPSLAIAVTLAADAMTVILAVPGAVTRTQTLESILEGLEAMEVHRQLMQARRNDEDVQLRQAQDQEYADALARDQAAAARAQQAPQAPQAALPVPPTARPETRPPHVDERHVAAAEQFLSEAPNGQDGDGRDDAVRLVLKLPSGERVERTFNAQEPLSRVQQWARCCPWLPEAEGRQLVIPAAFQLAMAFPRRRFTAADCERSLRDLGLAPSAALLLIDEG